MKKSRLIGALYAVVFSVIALPLIYIPEIAFGAANTGQDPSTTPSAISSSDAVRHALKPRIPAKKPNKIVVPAKGVNKDVIIIKFVEGSKVRLRGGKFVSLSSSNSSKLSKSLEKNNNQILRPDIRQVKRRFTRPEADLDAEKVKGERLSRQQLADLNLYYEIRLVPGTDPEPILVDLNALDSVEIAYLEPIPEPAATPQINATASALPGCIAPPSSNTDFEYLQHYLCNRDTGVHAYYGWTQTGGAGAGVEVIDIEFGWREHHEDFPPNFTSVNGVNSTVPGYYNHGTAVVGVMGAPRDGKGVTGIAYDAQYNAVSVDLDPNFPNIGTDVNTEDLISRASSAISQGDFILIELHALGPTPVSGVICNCNCGQFKFIAMEYWQANYDAILTATANGRIVVEAAGNGSMDLDDPIYGGKFDRSTGKDSGAILVGAGSSTSRDPLCFTNYGSRVDLQGWGENIVTTGYGDLFNGTQDGGVNDIDRHYTAIFSGTSGASPIVTGSAAAVQGRYKVISGGSVLTAHEMLQILKDNGTPQGTVGGSKQIGPLPNISASMQDMSGAPHASVVYDVDETGLVEQDNGDPGDVSTSYSVDPVDLLENCAIGVESCSIKYRISGQASTDGNILTVSGDDASVAGPVTFNYITSGALAFDISVYISYLGVAAVDATGFFVNPAGPATAAPLVLSSTGLGGLSATLNGANVPRGNITRHEFIADSFSNTVSGVPAGSGSLTLDINLSCASDAGNGGECITAVGKNSELPSFSVNMPADAGDPDYGIYVTIKFLPVGVPDQSPPLLTITSPISGTPVNNPNVTLNGVATDNGRGGSGINSVAVNAAAATNDNATGNAAAIWTYGATLMPGANNLTIVATDGSPNANQTTNVLALTYIPFSLDTDGDGLDDTFETAIGTNPNLSDTDSDGINDGLELSYDGDNSFYNQNTDTDPTNSDTDGDGFSDGDEIAAGTDPLNSASQPLPDGDVNGDGFVDVADLLLAMRILNGQYTPTQAEQNRWDVAPLVSGIPQPDGQNTLGDYTVLQRKVIGEINF